MSELFAQPIAQIVAAVLGALAVLSILDDAAAELAGRIPVIGPIAARLARWASGRFRAWLGERIPAIADRVVRQIEGSHDGAPGVTKLQAATDAILASPAAAGLRPEEATAAAQAAVDRAKAAPGLAIDHGALARAVEKTAAELEAAYEQLLRDRDRAASEPMHAAPTDTIPDAPVPYPTFSIGQTALDNTPTER